MSTNKKGKSNLKRILAIVFLLLSLIGTASMGSEVRLFVDIPSLILIILFTFPMLILADLFQDFIRGYKIATGSFEYTLKELKASKNAMDLCIKLVYISSVIGAIIGFVSSIRYIGDLSKVGPAIAVSILTVFYAFIINLVQHAVSAKIKKEIIYREQ
ncbi:MAG: hypothetical protein N4A48_12345 [Tepidibacter sp.]|uniref:hypothetical protein n=1 Tax=Tepidibacter sp. TaxID=2529387 RepID=UPI0025E5BA9A|nr:hypothetical protein [Tepidibacter sp.]MCT4509519.1 hypothetical protein [Tepidibacter sp.]